MKSIITLFFLLFSFIVGYGQRIVIANKQWEGFKNEYPQGNYNSKFRSESKVIDGKVYNELMYKVEGGWFEGVKQYYREEDNKVYRLYDGEERVIFDFTLNVGDTILISDDNGKKYDFFPIRTADTTILNRVLRKLEMRVIPENSQTVSSEKHVWIEGVGDTGFFFGYGVVFNNQKATPINCVKEGSFFYAAAMFCPGYMPTNTDDDPTEIDFHYDQFSKVIIIKNDKIKSLNIYTISGMKLRSIQITESIKHIDVSNIDQHLCVVVLFDGISYSSKILKL
jgi:hypothetical protein